MRILLSIVDSLKVGTADLLEEIIVIDTWVVKFEGWENSQRVEVMIDATVDNLSIQRCHNDSGLGAIFDFSWVSFVLVRIKLGNHVLNLGGAFYEFFEGFLPW